MASLLSVPLVLHSYAVITLDENELDRRVKNLEALGWAKSGAVQHFATVQASVRVQVMLSVTAVTLEDSPRILLQPVPNK